MSFQSAGLTFFVCMLPAFFVPAVGNPGNNGTCDDVSLLQTRIGLHAHKHTALNCLGWSGGHFPCSDFSAPTRIDVAFDRTDGCATDNGRGDRWRKCCPDKDGGVNRDRCMDACNAQATGPGCCSYRCADAAFYGKGCYWSPNDGQTAYNGNADTFGNVCHLTTLGEHFDHIHDSKSLTCGYGSYDGSDSTITQTHLGVPSLDHCARLCIDAGTSTNPCIALQFNDDNRTEDLEGKCTIKLFQYIVKNHLDANSGKALVPDVVNPCSGTNHDGEIYVRKGCGACVGGQTSCPECAEEGEAEPPQVHGADCPTSDNVYVRLTTEGTTCESESLHAIETTDDCREAIEALECPNKASQDYEEVSEVSYSFRPKGCYSNCYSDFAGFFCRMFNSHATGDPSVGVDLDWIAGGAHHRIIYCRTA